MMRIGGVGTVFGSGSGLGEELERLGQFERLGFAFLLAYGLTWVVASLLWRARGARVGAYAVLFQGVVALPLAFGLQSLVENGTAPMDPILSQLLVVLAVSQVFALPLVIVLVATRRWLASGLVMAVVTAVHFVPYSWLYRTPLYYVLAGVLAVGIPVTFRLSTRRDDATDRDIWPVFGVVGLCLLAAAITAFLG